MANTRQSAKRARQNQKRQTVNQHVRSATKTAVRTAVEAIQNKDLSGAKNAYASAISTLAKAANKGGIPAKRASRKISRLTKLAKRLLPESLTQK